MSLIPVKVLTTEKVDDRLVFMTVEKPAGLTYKPGQFVRCALPLVENPQTDSDFIARPYSMASHPNDEELAFFIAKLPDGEMSPQMFDLNAGDTLYVDDTAWGMMTDMRLAKGETLLMMASGTGLASFLSFMKDDLWSRYDRVIIVHSVRKNIDHALTERILNEARGHENAFDFVSITTREPNVSKMNGFNQRLPELIESGEFEKMLGVELTPEKARVILCGNPDFVQAVKTQLKARGFTAPRRGQMGTLVSETY